MKKSRAIIILLIILAVAVGIGYIDIFGTNSRKAGSASDIELGLDLAGGVSITYQVKDDAHPDQEAMDDTIYKLQQRVANYSTEAVVYKEGENRINIEIPGVSDAEAILSELGQPGTLYFIAEYGSDGTYNYTGSNGSYSFYGGKTIESIIADGSCVIAGTDVADARAATVQDSLGNAENIVSLTLTDAGTTKFAEATQIAYSGGQTIAIYYDGKIICAPTVSAVITDGNAQITGGYTYDEAAQLASTIRIGGLSLELEQLHYKVVGAQLGADAISTSLKAGAIGFGVVAIFMIAVYFMPGAAAVLALIVYIVLVVILLNGFDMTLTLSGIAGIILSVGMAVDANVVIFARIREEIGAGVSVDSAIKTGFNKALSAIIDGNVTTLIAAIVLMILGPSSVKGFAQTLALGIVLSMFTSLVVTRLIIQALYALGMKDARWYGRGKERKPVNFLGKRMIFFGASGAVILAGVIVMLVQFGIGNGLMNYSIEFKGGTSTDVIFNESWTIDELTAKVAPQIEDITGSSVQIQTVNGSNEVIFKTNEIDEATTEQLKDMLVANYQLDESAITTESISSTISSEMTRKTIIAVVVAIACMLVYIRIRFRDMRFGISSIIALAHDVLVVIAFYAAARVSVGNTFVACLLTIVGYSINATIVIFDRIRENERGNSRESLEDVVNKSITQTLSRSIFTSLTTFIMVAFLYGFGVSSIRDFALPLMVGIACGCYSSICLAGGVWFTLRKKFPGKKAN